MLTLNSNKPNIILIHNGGYVILIKFEYSVVFIFGTYP